jgi:hypothetical protein
LPAAIGLAVAAAAVVGRLETRRERFGETIRIKKLEIVGTDGAVRVALGETTDGAGAVATYDGAGRVTACLGATPPGEPSWPRSRREA